MYSLISNDVFCNYNIGEYIWLSKNFIIFRIKCKNLKINFDFNNQNSSNFKDKLLYVIDISWQIKLLQKN